VGQVPCESTEFTIIFTTTCVATALSNSGSFDKFSHLLRVGEVSKVKCESLNSIERKRFLTVMKVLKTRLGYQ